MSTAMDPRVDAYIESAAEFARPVLAEIRRRVHAAVPGVEETIKWRFPCFQHQGRLLCTMAAHKAHVSFGFWKSKELLGEDAERGVMGDFGKLVSVGQLPDEGRFAELLRQAVELASAPAAAKPRPRAAVAEPELPEALRSALDRQPEIAARFAAMAPSHRREYGEWIAEAKTEATRDKRLAQAIEWIGEGKSRHWKYQKR